MGHTFARLFTRRRSRRDESPGEKPAVDGDAMALDDDELGPPPVLLPAAIFHELLFDPAEMTPAWLRPRPAAAPDPATSTGPAVDVTVVADVAPTDERKPAKRTRRPKADVSSGSTRARSRRVAKPDQDVDNR